MENREAAQHGDEKKKRMGRLCGGTPCGLRHKRPANYPSGGDRQHRRAGESELQERHRLMERLLTQAW